MSSSSHGLPMTVIITRQILAVKALLCVPLAYVDWPSHAFCLGGGRRQATTCYHAEKIRKGTRELSWDYSTHNLT